MILTPNNTKELIDNVLPPGGRIERSTIFRGTTPIADIAVNEAGVFINTTWFPFGEIAERRVDGLRRLLSL